jgi:hypothetical protein
MSRMTTHFNDIAADAAIDALAALIDLPIPPAHRVGTVLNLQRVAMAAAQVMSFELPPETEPATIYANDRV